MACHDGVNKTVDVVVLVESIKDAMDKASDIMRLYVNAWADIFHGLGAALATAVAGNVNDAHTQLYNLSTEEFKLTGDCEAIGAVLELWENTVVTAGPNSPGPIDELCAPPDGCHWQEHTPSNPGKVLQLWQLQRGYTLLGLVKKLADSGFSAHAINPDGPEMWHEPYLGLTLFDVSSWLVRQKQQ